jgi:hypothetical protein
MDVDNFGNPEGKVFMAFHYNLDEEAIPVLTTGYGNSKVDNDEREYGLVDKLIDALLTVRGCVGIRFSIADVQRLRPDLDAAHCMFILENFKWFHDPTKGSDLDFLKSAAEGIYPK